MVSVDKEFNQGTMEMTYLLHEDWDFAGRSQDWEQETSESLFTPMSDNGCWLSPRGLHGAVRLNTHTWFLRVAWASPQHAGYVFKG